MSDSNDLKPLLTKLLSVVEGTAQDLAAVKVELSGTKDEIGGMKAEQTAIKHELQLMNTRLDGIERRLDDQGRILAALVPTRIAAVPPPAAE